MNFRVRVYVTLKPTVNDPQGLTVKGGLHSLGFASVTDVRVGKFIELSLEAADHQEAQEQVERMCRQLLANPVIEVSRFDLEATPGQVPVS